MPILQAARSLTINTALGPDVLAVRSIAVHEQLSRPFQIDAELSSEDANIDLDEVIGHPAAIALDIGDNGTRYFNGFVSRMVQVANQGGYAHYEATIVPWLWLLSRTSDCRIFQHKTVPDIIEAVFQAHGLHDYQLKLSATYQPWEYCVQYRETDLNFVSRLMEEEGIYYFFEHEDGKHTLVLADSISSHKAAEGYKQITYHDAETHATSREVITNWEMEKEIQPVACAMTDFDFTKPKTSLLASSSVSRKHGQAEFEIFDYPGDYADHGEGDRITDVRLDEIQARYEILHGQGTVRGLAAGALFELKNHPRDDQNGEYLVTAVNLRAETGEYASSRNGADGGEFFSCCFAAIPKTQQFRAQRVTPKPVVQGPQTAIVVGPPGEEIHTDKYGRVKVLFHWDRYSKADENSSCWVRVAQSAAGKGWGSIFIPRVGQEVMVEFLEGDPDMPIITGRVYNGEAMPPYPLPDHKTLTSFKSNSTKGGGGFNELRFEDKKGEEQIFMHGEKNLDIRIKNDAFEWIGNDRHLIVKKDQLEHVENNRSETVDADHMEKIGKDRHLHVLGKEAKAVDGSLSLTVKGDVIEVFKANHSEQTSNDYYLKADNVVIEGMTNVTIKVGGSSIAIAADGIALKTDGLVKLEAGSTMDLKADAPLTIQSSATAEMKSSATTVKGDGQLTLKGGVVMIN
jgi:type VI secretion system secreted protein VgrG